MNAKWRGRITSLNLLAPFSLMAARMLLVFFAARMYHSPVSPAC